MSSNTKHKPKIAVFKFASCDGCQLSLLDAEDELLGVVGAIEIAYFPEATRAVLKGPYDIGLVEGSVTTHHDAQRIQEVRRQCKTLVTIGVDLSKMNTIGDLQGGLEEAERLLGYRVTRETPETRS